MCNSWSESTPSTFSIDDLTSSDEIVAGTPCRRINEALRTEKFYV